MGRGVKELLDKQREEIEGRARKEHEEALDRQREVNEERVVREVEEALNRHGGRN